MGGLRRRKLTSDVSVMLMACGALAAPLTSHADNGPFTAPDNGITNPDLTKSEDIMKGNVAP